MGKKFERLVNPKKDCFSYDRASYVCELLEVKSCDNCSFYKNWEQFEADQERARGLLRAKGDIRLVKKYL